MKRKQLFFFFALNWIKIGYYNFEGITMMKLIDTLLLESSAMALQWEALEKKVASSSKWLMVL
jgi:hypothetical protein